ncbi:MAG: zinc ribbon domain-containing protein [Acidobacteriota bacterium]
MPLYEYQCESCSQRFEVLQRMGDGCEGVTCPECGGDRVRKQLSTFASSTGSSSSASSAGAAGACGAPGSGFG